MVAKSRSHHSSVKIKCQTTPELDEKVTEKFGLPHLLNDKNYELFHIEIETTFGNKLGIQLNDSCVVNSVNREDVEVIFGDLWLEINGLWLEDKRHFTEIYRKMKREANNSLKLKLKIARLLWKQNLPEDRMPMDILPRREYKYHLAVIYGIPKMHLTLALKAINGKVFVSGVSEETLGRMAFSVGDAILDVDNCMVGSITGAYELLKQNLKQHGVVSCVVERADSKNANFYVLEAIRSEKNPHKEERLNKDVEKICRREKRKNFRGEEIQASKSIIKGKNSKSYKTIHVAFKPTHDVVHINADINPLLLQPVPSHNVLPTDTLLAPGRSAESILSELSSEATTEEGHQEQKQSKFRPMRQKDCRLTTGTKVIKQKRSTENPKSPAPSSAATASTTTTGKKSSTPNDSPRDTKDSDSGKKCPTIMAITKTQTDSGKRTITTTKTTQNTTDSGKRAITTLKTQNTDSGRRGSTSKTQSKTPQDTDSRKKTTTISTNNNNNPTDSRKKNSTPKIIKTSFSRDNSPKNSNSLR
uniref:PDZ domain-containing protein n=1 Tax=Panagrolaimus sp. ES5 TaxID=591445 RepID=A0AC34GVU2_9BILA